MVCARLSKTFLAGAVAGAVGLASTASLEARPLPVATAATIAGDAPDVLDLALGEQSQAVVVDDLQPWINYWRRPDAAATGRVAMLGDEEFERPPPMFAEADIFGFAELLAARERRC